MWRAATRGHSHRQRCLVLQANVQGQRCYAAAAAQAARKKRGLSEKDLKGSASPPKAPGAPPPGGDAGGGGSGLPILGALGAASAGVAGYMYYTGALDESILNAIGAKETTANVASHEKAAAVAEKPEPVDTEEKVSPSMPSGNRVEQIEMPPEMMNKSSESAVEASDHPVGGNRVSMEPPKPVKKEKAKKQRKKKAKEETKQDTSLTNKAIQQLQSTANMEAAKSLVQSHQSLWGSLDETYLDDLDDLSPSQLKARVAQLATELKDRTQWEAVRLKEFLALKEKETAQQYTELLQKQRIEFENLLATRLREQDDTFRAKLMEALSQKDATIQSLIDAALASQQEEHDQDKEAFTVKLKEETRMEIDEHYGDQMETYKQQTEQTLREKVETLAKLSDKLQRLESALEASERTQQGSSIAHRLSAAALALSEVLETHAPAANEVQALKTAAGTDGVIATAVRTLPSTVETNGVPTLPELQTKFEENYSTCRQAALVPPGRPGLDGQLAGYVFAALKYPPRPDDPAPESDPSSAEHVLARARKQVQLGELSSAVDELEKLQGQVAFVIDDWKKAAMDRIAVDKAIKVIKLECALLHEACAAE